MHSDGFAEGVPIVLCNSLGTTKAMWDGVVPSLAGKHRVIRYEYPGHGGRERAQGSIDIDDLVDDLLGLMDEESIERAHLVGISIGGMIGIRAAARAATRVETLVVLCSSPRLPYAAWWERAAIVRESGMSTLIELIADRWFTKPFRQAFPETVERYLDMLRGTDVEGYAQACELLARADIRPDLARVLAPTLVIAGGEDFATPLRDVEAIARGIKNSKLEVLDGVSHMAVAAAGPRVSNAIARHVLSEAPR